MEFGNSVPVFEAWAYGESAEAGYAPRLQAGWYAEAGPREVGKDGSVSTFVDVGNGMVQRAIIDIGKLISFANDSSDFDRARLLTLRAGADETEVIRLLVAAALLALRAGVDETEVIMRLLAAGKEN